MSLLTPWSGDWIRDVVSSHQIDHFDALSDEPIEFWVTRDIVQYQNNFKRQPFTGKVLPDLSDKASMESIQ